MAYKDKQKEKAYLKDYYSKAENKERNKKIQKQIYADRKPQLVKYYIRKYCEFAKISIEEFQKSFRNRWNFETLKKNYLKIKNKEKSV